MGHKVSHYEYDMFIVDLRCQRASRNTNYTQKSKVSHIKVNFPWKSKSSHGKTVCLFYIRITMSVRFKTVESLPFLFFYYFVFYFISSCKSINKLLMVLTFTAIHFTWSWSNTTIVYLCLEPSTVRLLNNRKSC